MQHIKFAQNSKNPDDWRPEYLARRHRIDPRIAEIYLSDWARPYWEPKS